ncbi:MAG: antibiotic biosynthesis monooxygenase [Proteobacteria bacterium]|nr:antibiotic biosynthesis monooxygenase [Pseudomonadota bacterium]
MFAVMYRWQLAPGSEARFADAWRVMTEAIRQRNGTQGSRLHRADDGDFVAYAAWPSREAWEAAGHLPPADPVAFATMRECIAVSRGATPLAILDDLLG